MAGEEEEAKVVRGAYLLILLQVVSRAITFVANQFLLRFLTAQLLGISTQLEVYYLSVLFFARESLRVAIQRQGSIRPSPDPSRQAQAQAQDQTQNGAAAKQEPCPPKQQSQQETQAVVNLSYLSIGLGVLVAVLLGSMYLQSVPLTTVRETPYFVPSVYIYAAASVLELLSEPAFVVTQIRLQFAARARAEGLATFAKCVATLASAVWAARHGVALGVLPFALGQVAFGLALLGSYTVQHLLYGDGEGFSLMPRRMGGAGGRRQGGNHSYVLSYFYRPTLTLACSMMLQSFVKHLLTQGDTFLVSILSTPTAQGVYALANNYGGLAARLVFQPVEESSRSYFSRLLSSTGSNGSTITTTAQPPPITREKPHENDGNAPPQRMPHPSDQSSSPSLATLAQASESLTSLLRLYAIVSLPLVALGPTAAPLLLSIVAGPQWTSSGAGNALAAYVYYIPLLAINGLTEAFVASVATETQVHRQSAWMTAFSLVFAAAGYLFMRVLDWGAVGLVWANGINMSCRIAWALWFIRGYFTSTRSTTSVTAGKAQQGGAGAGAGTDVAWDPAEVLPSPMAIAAAAVASQVVKRTIAVPGGIYVGAGADVAAGDIKAVLFELVKIACVAVPFIGAL